MKVRSLQLADPPPIGSPDYKITPFREAIHAARSRGVVLPDAYYGELQGVARSHAFSIAGVSKMAQLQGVLDSLGDNMEKGGTFKRWKERVRGGFIGLDLPRHRLENIFRTNLQGMLARGRCEHIELHQGERPYLRYDATMDSRVRPSHAAMDGHVAPVGDAVWGNWMPPNGYQCRCGVVSLTEEQAARYGDADAQARQNNPERAKARNDALSHGPDSGWGYSPCDNPDASMEAALEHYGVALPAVFNDALRRMREQVPVAQAADPATWTKVGEQKGSNEGGLYEAPDGQQHYVKFPENTDQARAEVASNEVQRLMGVNVPESKIVEMDGRTGIALKWRDDLGMSGKQALKDADTEEIAKAFQGAVLTKNWDVVGMEFDNLKVADNGDVVALDAGGSFTFRAQGGTKAFTGGPVEELESFLDPSINSQAAEVFGAHGAKNLKKKFSSRLRDLKKKDLEEAFAQAGFGLEQTKAFVDATWARRNWLIQALKRKPTTTKNAADPFEKSAKMTGAQAEAGVKNVKGVGSEKWREAMAKAERRGFSGDDAKFQAAVNVYTDNHFRAINKDLRQKGGNVDDAALAITEGLRRREKYRGPVRRGVDADGELLERLVQTHEAAMKKGTPVQLNGFVSSSYSGGFDGNVHVHIDAKGAQGAVVEDISQFPNEKEVLFPHGAKFRVNDIQRSGSRVDVWLEEDPALIQQDGEEFSLPGP